MYIRKSVSKQKGKTYTNYLLVESIKTPKGPRQHVVCSLGNLAPAPREEWLALAHKLEASLRGQLALGTSKEEIEKIIAEARRTKKRAYFINPSSVIEVDSDQVDVELAREAGPAHVGHQIWRQLRLDDILHHADLSDRARIVTEAMTLNRLIHPLSEHAMPDWIRRTALSDILNEDFSGLEDESLYRNLDRLHPKRELIERELAEHEKALFNLDDTIYLYDLTSTYFEGQALLNNQAKRGYSRDKRPDCKQVVVGLVLDRDGFPKAHEVFDGNAQDRNTVDQMLDALEKRTGKKPQGTVIVDRGMAYEENIQQILNRGLHYLVAGLQSERNQWLDELEKDDWQPVIRTPSPRNPFQKKTKVEVKLREKGDVVYILCRSESRKEKDRAIRETHEGKLLEDVQKLQQRVAKGHLKKAEKIQQAIGRIMERYPRVARYHRISYDSDRKQLVSHEEVEKKGVAEKLDGSYVMKTDQKDMTADEIWRTYILLTRVEDAFRDIKSPLMERPIFHHLKNRTQTHIFLCVLAYHLLAAIEHRFLQHGIHTSWWTLRQELSTHQVVTVVLPTTDGRVMRIRKATAPEQTHREIYSILSIPMEVIAPVKTWHRPVPDAENSD
jgi:transposase